MRGTRGARHGWLLNCTYWTTYYQIDWFDCGALQNGLLLSQGIGLNLRPCEKKPLACCQSLTKNEGGWEWGKGGFLNCTYCMYILLPNRLVWKWSPPEWTAPISGNCTDPETLGKLSLDFSHSMLKIRGQGGSLTVHYVGKFYYQTDWFESGALQNEMLPSQVIGLIQRALGKNLWTVGRPWLKMRGTRGARQERLLNCTYCITYLVFWCLLKHI